MGNFIDRINLRTMRSAPVVAHYSRSNELAPHEQASLDHVLKDVEGGAVLDIGVGAGRTVKALLRVSDNYLGVDYSPEMVFACQERFPGIRFEHADARNLSNILDASIALAVFSCNGISMVSHLDRLLILREVYRVLQPGGVFLFTTYNLRSPEASAGFRFPELLLSANPLRLLVRLARFARDTTVGVYQRIKYVKHEFRMIDYALVNDRCHNYGVMLYYTTLEHQRRQLEEVGFQPDALAFDRTGCVIIGDTLLDSMALVARKA